MESNEWPPIDIPMPVSPEPVIPQDQVTIYPSKDLNQTLYRGLPITVFPLSCFDVINNPDTTTPDAISCIRQLQASRSFLVVKGKESWPSQADWDKFEIDFTKMKREGMAPNVLYSASSKFKKFLLE